MNVYRLSLKENTMSYEIGYRRPPKTGQFKKGQSGNPKGRPKGSGNFMTLLDQELNQTITVNENGKKKEITRLHAAVKRLVSDVLQGNQKTMMSMFEMMRRAGKFEEADVDDQISNDYAAILETFIAKREKSASKKPTKTSKKETS
jgi:hypothetical protein